MVRVRSERGPEQGGLSEVVNCINLKYAFNCELDRKATKWVLTKISPLPLTSNPVLDEITRAPRVWHPLTTLDFAPLHALYHHRELIIESVDTHADEVTLRFKNPVATGTPALDAMANGSFTLDRAHQWALRRAHVVMRRSKGTVTYSCTNTFVNVNGVPRPVRSEFERLFVSGGTEYRTHSVSEYEVVDQSTLQETDFTLSAFGLPEPYGVTWDRPTPWWLYALFSAGVLFVVAVIVSFWKRRLAARQAA
ncbi:MAG TPA: hypothetical protein PKC18_00880 [Lacipirellulaceae bacterium]|nr:hypothetical protein [Lacipirellulaceae bacterium]